MVSTVFSKMTIIQYSCSIHLYIRSPSRSNFIKLDFPGLDFPFIECAFVRFLQHLGHPRYETQVQQLCVCNDSVTVPSSKSLYETFSSMNLHVLPLMKETHKVSLYVQYSSTVYAVHVVYIICPLSEQYCIMLARLPHNYCIITVTCVTYGTM